MKPHKVILGPKEFEKYIAACVYAFEINEEIEISAIGENLHKMERLIKLFSKLGCTEINRREEKVKGWRAVVCKLRRIKDLNT